MDMQETKAEAAVGRQNIESMLGVVMEKLGGICQVNTVVGEPVSANGTTIIPISKVSLGFVAGGGEYGAKAQSSEPVFGGGSGGGLTVAPVGFLTSCSGGTMRYIPVNGQEPLEKLLDMTPGLLSKMEDIMRNTANKQPNMP